MKTIKQAAVDSGISTRLIKAVIRELNSKEQLEDVLRNGAAAGYGGFIYYHDTVKFSEKYRREIVNMIKDMADQFEETPIDFVATFNCLKQWNEGADKRDLIDAIGFYIYSNQPEDAIHETNDLAIQVFNAMAWFALEEVARAMCDE